MNGPWRSCKAVSVALLSVRWRRLCRVSNCTLAHTPSGMSTIMRMPMIPVGSSNDTMMVAAMIMTTRNTTTMPK